MLKYQKQKSNSSTLLTTILAFVQVGLVIIGLIGVSMRLFEDKGWLQQWLTSIMDAKFGNLIVGAVLLFIGGYLLRSWMAGSEGKQGMVADAMLYLMTGVGMYFVFHIVTEGGF